MFEKEAEEYIMREDVSTENDRVPFDNGYGFQTVSFEDEVKKAFKDGAEFGYNKAFVEADKNLKAIVIDFNKANEWHRVSDKLPEMDVFVYLWKEGKNFTLVARRHISYGQKEWVWDCMWGCGFIMSQSMGKDYWWKEIVLPKEMKEND